jgi:predicted phosphodiesterase
MRESSLRTGALRPGLLRPRFGLPAIAASGAPFVVETLEAPAAKTPPSLSLRAAGGSPPIALTVDEESVTARDGQTVVRRVVRAIGAAAGGYDLVVDRGDGSPSVAPRSVWLRDADPDHPAGFQIAHLTDLHVSGSSRGNARLEKVIADLNRLAPDLVLCGGDLVNNGDRPERFADARRLLGSLAAPVLVVPGNHDHGFHPRALAGGFGPGWGHFADAFHPYLHFCLPFGGWDFIGFDSGPSRLSPLVRTRGIDAAALAAVARDLDDSHARQRRGVVILSHTPSRARLTGSRASSIRGVVGRMGRGARAFEDLLQISAKRGQRVVHLTGHTHWTEVFELDPESGRFTRWDHRRFDLGAQAIEQPVALVNSQSASHGGIPFKRNSRGHGFTRLFLDENLPRVEFHRYLTDD